MTKLLTTLCTLALAACSNNDGIRGDGAGSDDDFEIDCISDTCQCPTLSSCAHACDPGGAPCHVQCAANQPCDVTCEPTEECHVQAATASQLVVDCAGTFECHVTCPASGCRVENCVGDECVVTCGLTATPATFSGTTATCP